MKITQIDAFEKSFDKEIIVKPKIKKGFRALHNKLQALYKEVGDYAYAQQYIQAKGESIELIKKRWGNEVEKEILLGMFLTAVDEFSRYGDSIENWLEKVKISGYNYQ